MKRLILPDRVQNRILFFKNLVLIEAVFVFSTLSALRVSLFAFRRLIDHGQQVSFLAVYN